MKECREYMLSVLWRSLDPIDKVTYLDGSEQYFIPRLKLEKVNDNEYELLYTTRDVYSPVEDFLVEYAYHTSLRQLSDSLIFSNAFDRLEGLESDGKQLSDKAIDALKHKVKTLESKNILHLNQIKENYEKTTESIPSS
tara:strand:+ start:553 stop:969 length:417 start_codon:yes stop_codon:yes gene_type:complete